MPLAGHRCCLLSLSMHVKTYTLLFSNTIPHGMCVCVLTNLLYLVVYIDSLKCFYTTCEDKKLQGC